MPAELIHLANKNGIHIEFYNFETSIEGLYVKLPDCPPVIGLSKNMFKDFAHFRSVLAHELGHHFTMANDNPQKTFFHQRNGNNKCIHEYQAWKWAANYLIPEEKLLDALGHGINESKKLASLFEVDEEVVKIRIDSLKDNN